MNIANEKINKLKEKFGDIKSIKFSELYDLFKIIENDYEELYKKVPFDEKQCYDQFIDFARAISFEEVMKNKDHLIKLKNELCDMLEKFSNASIVRYYLGLNSYEVVGLEDGQENNVGISVGDGFEFKYFYSYFDPAWVESNEFDLYNSVDIIKMKKLIDDGVLTRGNKKQFLNRRSSALCYADNDVEIGSKLLSKYIDEKIVNPDHISKVLSEKIDNVFLWNHEKGYYEIDISALSDLLAKRANIHVPQKNILIEKIIAKFDKQFVHYVSFNVQRCINDHIKNNNIYIDLIHKEYKIAISICKSKEELNSLKEKIKNTNISNYVLVYPVLEEYAINNLDEVFNHINALINQSKNNSL